MTAIQSHTETATRHAEPLALHTTWRVGGAADVFCVPRNVTALSLVLAEYSGRPFLWLGLGSNVLARDGGFRGVVIATAGLTQLEAVSGGIYAQAGVPLAKLARFSVEQAYQGLEFFAGIPGTVGGALAMNAGAGGGDTWSFVSEVETIDASGKVRSRSPADFQVAYRSVLRPAQEWFVGAKFSLRTGDIADGRRRIKESLATRNRTQPMQTANAGSVFRNPPGEYAARLIETAGLKGYRVGAAVVSDRHANFIVNEGGARATDIERLIVAIQRKVHEHAGIILEPEVQIVGEGCE